MRTHKETAHSPLRPPLRVVAAALLLASNHEMTASIANAKEPQGTRQGAPKDSTSSAGVRKSAPNKWSFKNVGKGTPPIMSQESAVAWCASGGMLLPTLELAEHQIESLRAKPKGGPWCTWVRDDSDEARKNGDPERSTFACSNRLWLSATMGMVPYPLGALCFKPQRAHDPTLRCERFRVIDEAPADDNNSSEQGTPRSRVVSVVDTWTDRTWTMRPVCSDNGSMTRDQAAAECARRGGQLPSVVQAVEYLLSASNCAAMPEAGDWFAWTSSKGHSEGTGFLVDNGGAKVEMQTAELFPALCILGGSPPKPAQP